MQRRVFIAAGFSAILAFFLYFAAGGLNAYFTSDDVLNLQHLHGYFTTPISRVVLDTLNPLTSAYRPLGGVFYRTMYALTGYNPAPFRYVCYLLMIVNMALAFRLLRLLAGTWAALIGLLLISYNAAMSDLYYNTGTIYDILCYLLVIGSLAAYIARRQRGIEITGWFLAGLLLATMFALQAKEIGCMLPAGILLYEIVWYGIGRLPKSFHAAILTGALGAVMLLHRILTPNEMSNNPLYQPTLSLVHYLTTCARYHNLLFYSQDLFTVPRLLIFWSVMAILAFALRSRPMAFGLCFWIVGLAPVAVIPGRSAFVCYLPLTGVGLYFGALAARKLPAAAFALVFAALAVFHSHGRAAVLGPAIQIDRDSRAILTDLHQLHPKLEPGAHVLFVDDPFPRDSWFLTFAMRLLYRDPWILADRVKSRPHARIYNHVFTYTGGNLKELPLPPCPIDAAATKEPLDDSSLRICWQGPWTPGEFPKARDETLTFTNQKDAVARINFEGSSLTYVYTKAFNRGKAEVVIDGVSRGAVDEYDPAIVWQASTVFGGLAPGTHTAEVRVLHQRNAAASDYYVDIDAFIPG